MRSVLVVGHFVLEAKMGCVMGATVATSILSGEGFGGRVWSGLVDYLGIGSREPQAVSPRRVGWSCAAFEQERERLLA